MMVTQSAARATLAEAKGADRRAAGDRHESNMAARRRPSSGARPPSGVEAMATAPASPLPPGMGRVYVVSTGGANNPSLTLTINDAYGLRFTRQVDLVSDLGHFVVSPSFYPVVLAGRISLGVTFD